MTTNIVSKCKKWCFFESSFPSTLSDTSEITSERIARKALKLLILRSLYACTCTLS